jgi:serine/threonine-protein kinase
MAFWSWLLQQLGQPVEPRLDSPLQEVELSDAALPLISQPTTPDASLVDADLLAETGEVAQALALTERVLLENIDHPGARERHARWSARLGTRPAPVIDAGVTLLTSEPNAPFCLVREVARGGAGVVYEAEDPVLGRRVALKLLHRPDPELALHEARVASRFAGLHVVRVFDVGPDQGWLALEWAAGGSLRDALAEHDLRRLLPIEAWALPLATVLERMHRAGWGHGDIKPANVLFRAAGDVVLSDFGTARRAGEASTAGTLGYVSAERRASGALCNPRDDVVGFGRTLQNVLAAVDEAESNGRYKAWVSRCLRSDGLADGGALVGLFRGLV